MKTFSLVRAEADHLTRVEVDVVTFKTLSGSAPGITFG